MRFDDLKKIDLSLEIYKLIAFSGEVRGITTLEELKEDYIILVKDNKFYKKMIESLNSCTTANIGLITTRELADQLITFNESLVNRFSFIALAEDINLSICKLSEAFYKEIVKTYNDISDGRENSKIDPSVQFSSNVFIGKNVVIGENVIIHSGCNILSNSIIGARTILFPNVTIYQNVRIGKNCRIHSSSVIGADGFGYYFDKGIHHKIWHLGGVEIGDDVEIGASSMVDSGTFIPTRIGSGSKIDNSVQVGHNCNVKNGVILCGQAALSGSCKVGNYVVFGGKSGMAPDTSLEDGCQVAGGALVSKDWPKGSKLAGHPARPLKDWIRSNAFVQKAVKKVK